MFLSRRELLQHTGMGFGLLGAIGLLADSASANDQCGFSVRLLRQINATSVRLVYLNFRRIHLQSEQRLEKYPPPRPAGGAKERGEGRHHRTRKAGR